MILEDHHVHAVRELRLRRFRQLDLEHLVRDRHLAFLHDAFGRRRLGLRRRRLRGGGCEAQSAGGQRARKPTLNRDQCRPPLPGAEALGDVITTTRFSGVRYCFATRMTSFAFSFAARSYTVLISPGSPYIRVSSASIDARESDRVSEPTNCRREPLRDFSISQSAIGPAFRRSISA